MPQPAPWKVTFVGGPRCGETEEVTSLVVRIGDYRKAGRRVAAHTVYEYDPPPHKVKA